MHTIWISMCVSVCVSLCECYCLYVYVCVCVLVCLCVHQLCIFGSEVCVSMNVRTRNERCENLMCVFQGRPPNEPYPTFVTNLRPDETILMSFKLNELL